MIVERDDRYGETSQGPNWPLQNPSLTGVELGRGYERCVMTCFSKRSARICALVLIALLVVRCTSPLDGLDAFPGAQGYGKATKGGRGGKIMFVTNLNDAGPGSFRACAEATERRICVFRVGGIIRLQTQIRVAQYSGEVSILGQTAPGDGILLTINPNHSNEMPFLIINTNEILARHLRIRLQYPNTVDNVDAFAVVNSSQVYLDHVSGSWATDENFDAHGNTTHLTVAYSIFGEGLHPHSKCALLGSDPVVPQRISFWRNLCISNNDRNPDDHHYMGSCIEITNNVFYNARSEWAEVYTQLPGGTPVSYRGNYFKAGPNTNRQTYAIDWQQYSSVAPPKIYQTGNVTWAPVGSSIALVAPDTTAHFTSNPPCPIAATNLGRGESAYDHVRVYAGAFPRDAVDQRFISELGARGAKGRGSIKSAPGILPPMAFSSTAYVDRDNDGMADSQEDALGAKVGAFDPWLDGDKDGWPNLDEFMQWLSEERIAGRYPR